MRLLFIFLLFLSTLDLIGQTLVWSRAAGSERNEHLFFRREIKLEASPDSATLHLYADSRYALYVNGQYVNFGPARSFHAHPYFDTYDLLPYLERGDNVLAVHALGNGMETFQLFDYRGGFAAWGNIYVDGSQIDLGTNQGWQYRSSTGYDQTAPRFSFATGAMENWDSRGEADWNQIETTTDGWKRPVPLSDPEAFGEFAPRPIPHLTQEEVEPLRLFGAYPLRNDERIYSLRIPTPDANLQIYGKGHPARGATYIHSPRQQSVTIGLWWGDHYLNGEKLRPSDEQPRESYRRDYTLNLREGWNEFTMGYNIIWGSWDFYLAAPRSAELTFSADRRRDDSNWFATFGPFPDQQPSPAATLNPATPIEALRATGEWRLWSNTTDANQPARDLAWSEPDRSVHLLGELPSDAATPESIKIAPQPTGAALFFAMPENTLGRFFVEGDFPEGTRIDIGFSEELDEKGEPWLYKRFQIGAGIRFVTDERRARYTSFKPYGAKFVRLQFSNFSDTLTLKRFGMVRQVYPFDAIGYFRSSDPLMDRIWEAGWRTLQLCAEDSYTDTPFRERGLYAGDMLPEVAITAAVSGDMRLAEHSLRVFQDMYRREMYEGAENRHNDFPLITLLTADYVARYTGDWTLAREVYPNYVSLLDHHWSKRDRWGLIPASRVFLEWTDINKSNASMTAYQALNVRTLTILSDWSKRFGKREAEAEYAEKAAALADSTNQATSPLNTLLYYDGLAKYDGPAGDSMLFSTHLTSNIWPALYGVSTPFHLEAVLDWLPEELKDIGNQSRKRKITPYSSFYLFSLLYRHEMDDVAEAFMRKHWGPMALHSDRPTVWENFDISGNQGTSSHAWSGHPTFFLATEALGVNLGWTRPLSRDTIVIAPQSATLSWAEGTVAHPAGPVWVRWEIRGDQLFLRYRAPKGVPVRVEPRGRLWALELEVERY